MADQNEMEKIVTPMMEHLCDHLCRFPWETERKEDLEDICAGCQMGQYTNEILNTYNRMNEKATANENTETLLNPAGKYAAEFAENHGISFSEAMVAPMVKARFTYFNATGK